MNKEICKSQMTFGEIYVREKEGAGIISMSLHARRSANERE